MADITLKRGATSQRIRLRVASTSGGGLTNLTGGGSTIATGLAAYYFRDTDSAAVAFSLTAAAPGASFVGGQLAEIDAANMPGEFEFCITNAALAVGNGAALMFKGATNMVDKEYQVQLVAYDPYDSASLGLTAVVPSSNFKKNTARTNFEFVMTDSTTHIPTAGLTITSQRSIDGGALASTTNSAAGVSNGIYKLDLSAADTNGNVISYRFTATGADDLILTIVTQP